MNITAEICVIPMGVGVSVSRYIAACQPILENAGLNPPYGCRMGICHSCKCRVSEGTVRDLRNNEVHEIRDTDIQICIHAAAGDVALEI